MRKTLVAGIGGVAAAFLSALCCAGPLIFVMFGVGAGLAATFEPLRPIFGVVMIGAFALGFKAVYGRRSAPTTEGNGAACAMPRSRTREMAILWGALIVALILWTFPTWSVWLV